MHIKINVNTKLEIKELSDLPKLKIFMESLNMKINKSILAIDLNVDRRIIDKYLNGYRPGYTKKERQNLMMKETHPERIARHKTDIDNLKKYIESLIMKVL